MRNDQDALNTCILSRHQSWQYGVLDPADFPNGYRYFKKRAQCALTPALVHNNYAIGQRIKKRRFVKTGLWLVNKSMTLEQIESDFLVLKK